MPTQERREEIRKSADDLAKQKIKKLGMCGWSDCVPDIISQQEKNEINDIWMKMSGDSCWMSAMFEWLKQEPAA